MPEKNKNPSIVNLCRAMAHLNRASSIQLDLISKEVNNNSLPPDVECTDAMLLAFKNGIEEATNMAFSAMPAREAIKDIITQVLTHR